MKRYYFTIASILVLAIGITSCSNDETKTQNHYALRPTVPIQENTVKDIDGNIYRIVTIGIKSWTKTNLDVSRYRNGDPIPQVTDPTQWVNLTTGAWCYYNNDPANGLIYGKLYNWFAINDERGLAPVGWHVPSYPEWTDLDTFLGGAGISGGKIKAMTLWNSPNTGATNSSGFTGLPGGYRYGTNTSDGPFFYINTSSIWWSSTESYDESPSAWGRMIRHNSASTILSGAVKTCGFSVRCVRD